jgi:hypothetical protein
VNLEHRIEKLEGKHGRPWHRADLFDHISDAELMDMYLRVRKTVSQEEREDLDKLFGAYFKEVEEGSQG